MSAGKPRVHATFRPRSGERGYRQHFWPHPCTHGCRANDSTKVRLQVRSAGLRATGGLWPAIGDARLRGTTGAVPGNLAPPLAHRVCRPAAHSSIRIGDPPHVDGELHFELEQALPGHPVRTHFRGARRRLDLCGDVGNARQLFVHIRQHVRKLR